MANIIGTVEFENGTKQYSYDYDDVNDVFWSEKSDLLANNEGYWLKNFDNDEARFEQRMEDMVLGLVEGDPDQTDIEEMGSIKDWRYEISPGDNWTMFLPVGEKI